MKQVILVDINDNEIGQVEKLYAHTHCLLHRAFSIFIYRIRNDKIEYLLHRRNKDKYHSGGLWSNTCCSHPQPSESLADATKRRLNEEMGIAANLKKIGLHYYKVKIADDIFEHEMDHIFVGKWNGDDIHVDPEEVEGISWVTTEEIDSALLSTPEIYTAWFRDIFEITKLHEKSFI